VSCDGHVVRVGHLLQTSGSHPKVILDLYGRLGSGVQELVSFFASSKSCKRFLIANKPVIL
jgi:hypothetical protein